MKKLFASVAVLIIAGCASTPTGNIEAFGNATKGVTEKIDEVIKDYNHKELSNALEKIAQRTRPLKAERLKPIQDVLIDSADKPKYALYRANKALGEYADSLSGLAKAGSQQDFDLASTQLYSALSNFNEQHKTLTGETGDILPDSSSAGISKIIAAVGSLYAEKKRGEAIKEIVTKSHPAVLKICKIIKEELLKGVIEARIYTIKRTKLGSTIKDYNKVVATATIAKKRELLQEVYNEYLAMQSATASVTQAVKAIDEIKKAHTVLFNDISKDQWSSVSLSKSIGRLRDLNQHYDDLESLMLSCDHGVMASEEKTEEGKVIKKGLVCKPAPTPAAT